VEKRLRTEGISVSSTNSIIRPHRPCQPNSRQSTVLGFVSTLHSLIPGLTFRPQNLQKMSMIRSSVLRAQRLAPSAILARNASTSSYAVSNVTLADLEKRWENMPPAEQAELWMQLRDRMKGSWGELTAQEKKACMSTSSFPGFGGEVPR
jgi:hypothetical protein